MGYITLCWYIYFHLVSPIIWSAIIWFFLSTSDSKAFFWYPKSQLSPRHLLWAHLHTAFSPITKSALASCDLTGNICVVDPHRMVIIVPNAAYPVTGMSSISAVLYFISPSLPSVFFERSSLMLVHTRCFNHMRITTGRSFLWWSCFVYYCKFYAPSHTIFLLISIEISFELLLYCVRPSVSRITFLLLISLVTPFLYKSYLIQHL